MRVSTVIVFIGIFTSCVFIGGDANVVFEEDNRRQSGSMLAEIAQELFQKARSTQIINLNLSALLFLLLVKAAAIGAAYVGNYDRYKGRKLDEENLVSADEITLALGYLIGDTCLYRAACEVPKTAKEYLGAIDMVMETVKLLPQMSPVDSKYERKIGEFRKAIEYGELKHCPPEYTCKKENIDNFLRP